MVNLFLLHKYHYQTTFLTALQIGINNFKLKDWGKMSEWIKCSDRLPDDDTEVLVCYWFHMEFPSACYDLCTFVETDNKFISFRQGEHIECVTHWMPLPKPPED